MSLQVIAIYPLRISALAGRRGVRFRRQKKRESTLVPCGVQTENGRSVAIPEAPLPNDLPAPRYRGQFRLQRAAITHREAVHVLLAAERDAARLDPEQVVLSPIYHDQNIVLYEFQRAFIVTVQKRGDVETRYVAVHPVTGAVGTRTVHRFDHRWTSLIMRCAEHLAGGLDLYPAPQPRCQLRYQRMEVPEGEANVTFGHDREGDRP